MMNRRRIFALGTGLAITPAAVQASGRREAGQEREFGAVVGFHSSIVSGRELGTKICEALGLDPNKVSKVTLECSADDVAKVTVHSAVYEEEAKEVSEIMTQYALQEILK